MSVFLRVCLALSLFVLAACVPWTVRPLESAPSNKAGGGGGAAVAQTPTAFVESIWADKLIPALRQQAVDARQALQSPAEKLSMPRFRVLKGSGVILKIDTASRVGVALLDIAPLDGRADLSIQIGPVMRGTALRDATGLIPFSAFVNQIQYADVANELNARALRELSGKLDSNTKPGRSITFLGALEAETGATPALRWLVPVEIGVAP